MVAKSLTLERYIINICAALTEAEPVKNVEFWQVFRKVQATCFTRDG